MMDAAKIITLISLCLALGCATTRGAGVSGPALFVVLAYDVSGSVEEMPALTPGDLDSFVDVVSRRGGLVAFVPISEKASQPLERLRIVPVAGRLDERAQQATRNRSEVDQWKARVTLQLTAERDAPYTDLYGVLDRVSLFFNEPVIPDNAQRVLLLITDGKHTADKRPVPEIPYGIQILTVGIPLDLQGTLFGDRAVALESVAGAIEFLAVSDPEI